MAFRNGEFPEIVQNPGVPNEVDIFVNKTSAEYPLANITFNVMETPKFHEFEQAMENYTLGLDSETDTKVCRLIQILESFYNYLYVPFMNKKSKI